MPFGSSVSSSRGTSQRPSRRRSDRRSGLPHVRPMARRPAQLRTDEVATSRLTALRTRELCYLIVLAEDDLILTGVLLAIGEFCVRGSTSQSSAPRTIRRPAPFTFLRRVAGPPRGPVADGRHGVSRSAAFARANGACSVPVLTSEEVNGRGSPGAELDSGHVLDRSVAADLNAAHKTTK